MSGLDHLEGKVVSLTADGGSHPDRAVLGGDITAAETTYTDIVAGLRYYSRMQPMPLVTEAPNGTSQGRERKIHELVLYFLESTGGDFSPDIDRVTVNYISFGDDVVVFGSPDLVKFGSVQTALTDLIPSRTTHDDMDDPPPLYTGEIQVKLHGGWGDRGLWELRQSDPFPMTLLSTTTKFNVSSNP
jgi:hypothetical protein